MDQHPETRNLIAAAIFALNSNRFPFPAVRNANLAMFRIALVLWGIILRLNLVAFL
jgi:hypothetical protein